MSKSSLHVSVPERVLAFILTTQSVASNRFVTIREVTQFLANNATLRHIAYRAAVYVRDCHKWEGATIQNSKLFDAESQKIVNAYRIVNHDAYALHSDNVSSFAKRRFTYIRDKNNNKGYHVANATSLLDIRQTRYRGRIVIDTIDATYETMNDDDVKQIAPAMMQITHDNIDDSDDSLRGEDIHDIETSPDNIALAMIESANVSQEYDDIAINNDVKPKRKRNKVALAA